MHAGWRGEFWEVKSTDRKVEKLFWRNNFPSLPANPKKPLLEEFYSPILWPLSLDCKVPTHPRFVASFQCLRQQIHIRRWYLLVLVSAAQRSHAFSNFFGLFNITDVLIYVSPLKEMYWAPLPNPKMFSYCGGSRLWRNRWRSKMLIKKWNSPQWVSRDGFRWITLTALKLGSGVDPVS